MLNKQSFTQMVSAIPNLPDNLKWRFITIGESSSVTRKEIEQELLRFVEEQFDFNRTQAAFVRQLEHKWKLDLESAEQTSDMAFIDKQLL
ncbi:MAG: hypothetical protein WCX61_03145 [Candidatus Peribacteraceae bacterium]|jgi:hypothetical protein